MVNTKKAENYGLLVTLPATLDETELARLHELIAAKKDLIAKALGASHLDITTSSEGLSFPWWDELPEFEKITAYTEFLMRSMSCVLCFTASVLAVKKIRKYARFYLHH